MGTKTTAETVEVNFPGYPIFACSRCGHTWQPRAARVPRRCAYCRSPYWNRPRVRQIAVEDRGKVRSPRAARNGRKERAA